MAQALGVDIGYFFDDMDRERSFKPTPQQRLLLELSRSFLAISSRQHQEAICHLARALNPPELMGDPSSATPAVEDDRAAA
jgi:hypothetical protein